MSDGYQYNTMPRKILIEHCKAYSEQLHEMSGICQKLLMKLAAIERRKKEEQSDP